jgi:hypothetical protein
MEFFETIYAHFPRYYYCCIVGVIAAVAVAANDHFCIITIYYSTVISTLSL